MRDVLVVDLRGMKAALCEAARARGLTPSAMVREVIAAQLERAPPWAAQPLLGDGSVRLSLRMTASRAAALRTKARAAGVGLGTYVVSLCESGGQASSPRGSAAALTGSCASMSTLARSLRRLADLLRQANADAARPYRSMLDSLEGDVRAHLALAAATLAELKPLLRRAGRADAKDQP